jgi:hypothetical protein
MKGLAERTIVLIIVALLVLGIVTALLFVGVPSFRNAVKINSCKGEILQACSMNSGNCPTDPPDCATGLLKCEDTPAPCTIKAV